VTVRDVACWHIGKKPVWSDDVDRGHMGGGKNGFSGASVDSEKVLGEGNVVRRAGGRHGASSRVGNCVMGGWSRGVVG